MRWSPPALIPASQFDTAPAEAFREPGMIYMKTGRGAGARPLFETCLARKPGAFDRDMVKSCLHRIDRGGV